MCVCVYLYLYFTYLIPLPFFTSLRGMAIFSHCSVVLNLKNIPFKEKKKLTTAILDNGGHISYVVNQKVYAFFFFFPDVLSILIQHILYLF